MKIYVASSWRNQYQQDVVDSLREDGHDVYDFKNPRQNDHGFHWSEIDPNWKGWMPDQYSNALCHPLAQNGFKSDFYAMQWADVFVGVMPFGRSASMEMGWAAGQGKPTILYIPAHEQVEPELMAKMFTVIFTDFSAVRMALKTIKWNKK